MLPESGSAHLKGSQNERAPVERKRSPDNVFEVKAKQRSFHLLHKFYAFVQHRGCKPKRSHLRNEQMRFMRRSWACIIDGCPSTQRCTSFIKMRILPRFKWGLTSIKNPLSSVDMECTPNTSST